MPCSLALCQGCELPSRFKHFLSVTRDTLPQPFAKDFLPANWATGTPESIAGEKHMIALKSSVLTYNSLDLFLPTSTHLPGAASRNLSAKAPFVARETSPRDASILLRCAWLSKAACLSPFAALGAHGDQAPWLNPSLMYLHLERLNLSPQVHSQWVSSFSAERP